ncbi:hypothetical protein BBK36DRAFT_1117744 [Trichoderma citrinoviride]|uniref:Uncharacterized protein n=1 Tax=Trichoderma citrinoviride TaxID=58853 RepID=A0A2T4BCX7_9HYPO|nr:hypothetical protein BBK36DRAFT_1117744 [Trichoderma citrinoviride]PTB67184.1 hypothetical protein BBK36DRAFT_1117744 [Trichoderma citrinoviride]
MPSSLRSSSSTSTSSSSTNGQRPSSTAGGSSHRSSKSSSSSSWKSEYLPLSRDKGLPLRFIAYAAGASLPTTVKKMTRTETKDNDKQASGGPRWDFFGRDTQLFWVVVPEDRQNKKKRGRSRTSRERSTTATQQRSQSAASSQAAPPELNFPPEAAASSSRAPPWTGGSMTGMVPPQASGLPGYGQPKPAAGFPFGIPPVVNLPGGSSMPSFRRKQTC